MRHLGDVTKINGAEIESADIITFGAPCQDLSVAGLRKGMKHTSHGDDETTRSGLFFEAIRIMKEMRDADRKRGRANELIRPRYAIYENVAGAYSSNGGGDFQAVLTELIRIAEPTAPEVPLPEKGKWPAWDVIMGDGWSVAWRTHDAQYFGVPQRRKRICVLADFAGWTAGDILLDPQYRREAEEADTEQAQPDFGEESRSEVRPISESLHGDFEPSGAEKERAAEGTQICADSAGWSDGNGCGDDDTAICLQGNGIDRADTAGCNGRGWRRGGSYTLNTIDRPAVYLEDQGGV